eukprot:jgi/Tetstr1/444077/TSEL_003317.t1
MAAGRRRQVALPRTHARSWSLTAAAASGFVGFGLEPWDTLVGGSDVTVSNHVRDKGRTRRRGLPKAGAEVCVCGVAAAAGFHLLHRRLRRKGKGALLLEPAESCEPTAVLNADIAAQEEPAGEPPQAEHSDRSDLLRCYSSPSKTPRTLNMPMHSASPPERPPASVERALFQSAGDSGEAPARQQQVWDSAEGLACSMSRAKAANNAAMAALIGSCEALCGRQGRQPLDVPALRAVLSTSLREDSLVEGLIARVQAIEDARSKETAATQAGTDALQKRLDASQQEAADLRNELEAVHFVQRAATAEVASLQRRVAVLEGALVEADAAARGALGTLDVALDDFGKLQRLSAQMHAQSSLQQQAAVEACASEHRLTIADLREQLRAAEQRTRKQQEQVSATHSMSRVQKEVIYRLREEVSQLQHAQRAAWAAATAPSSEPRHAELVAALNHAIGSVRQLAGGGEPDDQAALIVQLESQLVELLEQQRRHKLRRSLDAKAPDRQSTPLSAADSAGNAAVDDADDGLFGFMPVTEMSRIAALLLAVSCDTEAARGKRPVRSCAPALAGNSPSQAARQAAEELAGMLATSRGLAEVVVKAGGVGILSRRLACIDSSRGSAAEGNAEQGLRPALLAVLRRLVDDGSQGSKALSELATSDGVPILTAVLSGRGADADDRLAAARILCALSSRPWCWAEMASQGATRALVSALDTDRPEDAELVELATLSCARLAADAASLEAIRRAGGRWLLGATARARTSSAAAREAARWVLQALDAEPSDGTRAPSLTMRAPEEQAPTGAVWVVDSPMRGGKQQIV